MYWNRISFTVSYRSSHFFPLRGVFQGICGFSNQTIAVFPLNKWDVLVPQTTRQERRAELTESETFPRRVEVPAAPQHKPQRQLFQALEFPFLLFLTHCWTKCFYQCYKCHCGGGGLVTKSCPAPRTVVFQAPLSMGFPRQEYRNESHFLLQGIFQPRCLTWVSCTVGRFFPDWATEHQSNESQNISSTTKCKKSKTDTHMERPQRSSPLFGQREWMTLTLSLSPG